MRRKGLLVRDGGPVNLDANQLDELLRTDGPTAAVDALIDGLEEASDYDRLFAACLLKARLELGLPTIRPASFDDVPGDRRQEFERAYVDSARRVGHLLLRAGRIGRAWAFFRTIQEPAPVADALDAVDASSLDYDAVNELLEVAIQEGANRVAGLRLMLATHGTCNTVSLTDQVMPSLTPAERRQVAAMLTRDVYATLVANIRREIKAKTGEEAPDGPLVSLIESRGWLFENANYHVDVSHLHAVVRFARSLECDDPELKQAMELADYGSRLDRQFQYAAEPPFDEFYPAHGAYFGAVADRRRSDSIRYFADRLEAVATGLDRPIVAYVLVDLLSRIGESEQAAAIAAAELGGLEEAGGFSFAGLCARSGRLDLAKASARDRGDLVAYLAASLGDAET